MKKNKDVEKVQTMEKYSMSRRTRMMKWRRRRR